jgi:hypothetical protein
MLATIAYMNGPEAVVDVHQEVAPAFLQVIFVLLFWLWN